MEVFGKTIDSFYYCLCKAMLTLLVLVHSNIPPMDNSIPSLQNPFNVTT
ncbi:hypothetical protein BC643_0744 [Mangrovibacterium diazotrophicum]|uniref:Uncharacterized protein n=1 Tax=Mangrovibacterium diazotrophicum TaxID=1261403 RepID=A0A419W4P2_9BACT|nr:hypothetical protein BC643_0744 [Mangrovibacterium diazotrophicum]